MDKDWAPPLIANCIQKFCNTKETIDGPAGKIDLIVTFDEHGISYHPNHIAVFRGVEYLMKNKLIEV